MPSRRFLVVVAVATILLFVLGAVVVQQRSAASWQAMQDTIAEIAGARTRAEYRRVPLWGLETSEPAFGHYNHAVMLAEELGDAAHSELMAVMREGDRATHATRSARARWLPILQALRRGAHAVDATKVLSAHIDLETGVPDLLACRRVAFAAVLEARSLRQVGRGFEAVQTTLDAATFGNDLTVRGLLIQQMIGNALTAIATSEAWPAEALAALDPRALDLLAAGLARLDARMPTRMSFDEDLIFLADHYAKAMGDAETKDLSAWRYGFSMRWMVSDAFHHVSSVMDRLERPSASWLDRKATLDREFAAVAQVPNAIVKVMCPNMTGAEIGLRQSLTQVRMLRAAIELHRGREPRPLQDPLGAGALRIEKTGNDYWIHSVGERGGKPLERTVKLLVLPGKPPK